MSELFSTTRDAIVFVAVVVGVYVVLIAAAQVLRRSRGVRFRWVFHAFAIAAGLLAAVHYTLREFSGREELLQHLVAATLLFAAFPLATLANHFLWTRTGSGRPAERAPRLLSDATTLVLSIALLFVVLQFVYGQQVPGLLAGSGVAAIILGLAMQDLLSNTLAGIALFVEKPFKTGDWLLIDGREARVVEVTWRSVRLLTDEDVFLDVPNSKVVQESIVNFHQPDPVHAVKTMIGLHYDIPPARAMAVLRQAAAAVPNTRRDLPPRIELMVLGNSAVEYEVEVMIDDHGNARQVLSDLRVNCWYAVRRAGMEIPYPQLTISRARPADTHAAARTAAGGALRRHAIFGVLGGNVIDRLVEVSPVRLFAPSEHLINQGAPGDSMFLLVQGTVEVRIDHEGRMNVVAQLGAGDVFGEMSMLTGDVRGATVVATAEVEVLEIQREPFAEHVRAQPDVLARLSEMLAQRQLANDQQLAQGERAVRVEQARVSLLHKFRRFFQLAD